MDRRISGGLGQNSSADARAVAERRANVSLSRVRSLGRLATLRLAARRGGLVGRGEWHTETVRTGVHRQQLAALDAGTRVARTPRTDSRRGRRCAPHRLGLGATAGLG